MTCSTSQSSTNCLTANYRVYYSDTYQDNLAGAEVLNTGKDEKGSYVCLDKTIFHPQGGGQPSDEGFIKLPNGTEIKITALGENKESGLIYHYFQGDQECFSAGQKVDMTIDLEKRRLFARLHTGGHLISNLVEKLYPQLEGYRGNHFPGGQSFVVFRGKPTPDKAEVKTRLTESLLEVTKDNLPIKTANPVTTDGKTSDRTVQIGDYKTYPCGGTHLKSTQELQGKISVRSIKNEKGELRVGYNIT